MEHYLLDHGHCHLGERSVMLCMQYVLFEFLVRVCYVISRNVIGSRLCAYMYVYHMYLSVGIIDFELSH